MLVFVSSFVRLAVAKKYLCSVVETRCCGLCVILLLCPVVVCSRHTHTRTHDTYNYFLSFRTTKNSTTKQITQKRNSTASAPAVGTTVHCLLCLPFYVLCLSSVFIVSVFAISLSISIYLSFSIRLINLSQCVSKCLCSFPRRRAYALLFTLTHANARVQTFTELCLNVKRK